ncbi:ABC transporter D family member 2, chloroplastic [Argentina anserina]|uniref:ABC transporter D family member 2, chloroplastic n=1 Tax=Argentina anserina TaxID=57926 RepID=UPI0021767751|nr:ABC transporter D family member 2, chloroplastic [Potentilla anserina]
MIILAQTQYISLSLPHSYSHGHIRSLTPFPSSLLAMPTPRRRRNHAASWRCATAASVPPPPVVPPIPPEKQREGSDLKTLLRRFWKVAAPYWSSDDKLQARIQLGSVFLLTLATTGISVGFNFLGRDFYNALANKDQEQFMKQLLYYLGAFAGGIPIFVLRDYARETLSLRWRSWMTRYYIDRYLSNQTFYRIQSQSIIDNPDQRIVDDLSSFTGTALSFSLTLFNAVIDLISFSNILFGIYPPLFVVLLVYSIGGTVISVYLGRGLVTLNFLQEKKEADFRYGLVRVRENAESIAFYSGEDNEMQLLLQRFKSAFENLTQLLISSRNLEFFTSGYRYLIQILPVAVVAPMYFTGKIEFGVINQSVSAFNHILGDFSLIVYQFQSISAFSAVIDRLGEFDDYLDISSQRQSDPAEGISLTYCNVKTLAELEPNGSMPIDKHEKLLAIENLTVQTPSSSTLVRDLSLVINNNENLLVTGPSGSGKTSLLRTLAGLWSAGKGKITFYVEDEEELLVLPSKSSDVAPLDTTANRNGELERPSNRNYKGIFFLPQRPYMVLGTLRQQLLYPTWANDEASTSGSSKSTGSLPFLMQAPNSKCKTAMPKPTTEDLIQALDDVCLGYILPRFSNLDSTYEWSSVLSLGEQQRLAFARLLLSKPKLVLLDESTSALDEANEAHLYKQIERAGITYISIGHRRTLYQYHNKNLRISTVDPSNAQQNWLVEPINQDNLYNLSNL